MSEPATQHPAQPMIRLSNVTRRFSGRSVVDGVSFDVPAGTTCGLIGLNGAGKTTLIRMLVGLLKPSGGTIHIAGNEVPAQRGAIKRLVGYVPDRPNVYPWMRVRQAIDFCRSIRGALNEQRVAGQLKLFRLDPEKRVKHLSKGMAAKLSLLLAMAHDPQVLILDEPTGGLDPLVHEEFIEGLLTATAQFGQTVLISSHTMSDVQRLADSVALMHEGKLRLHGPLDELLERSKRVRAVLTEPGARPPRATLPNILWQQVRGREWLITMKDFTDDSVRQLSQGNAIDHVDVYDVTLDDLFKDFVRGLQEQQEVAA
jgi:ABC-2 type transport system ATP-binding protein